MNQNTRICVVSTNKLFDDKSISLAENLGLSFQKEPDNSFPYHLVYTDNRLELQDNPLIKGTKRNSFFISFLHKDSIINRIRSTTIKDPLCKAIGIKQGIRPSVIDATAGLGLDGLSLGWLGCNVVLIERSKVMHALLEDGLERCRDNEKLANIIHSNISLVNDNSTTYLKNIKTFPDSILIDPMYPQKSGKGPLNKKEMRLLREIVGDDSDSKELFFTALKRAKKRVVVKRPKGAQLIDPATQPSHKIEMKSGRFDVYMINHLS